MIIKTEYTAALSIKDSITRSTTVLVAEEAVVKRLVIHLHKHHARSSAGDSTQRQCMT